MLAVELRRDADVVVALEVRRGRHAAGQLAAQAALELLAVGLGPDRVDQELQPRAAALLAVLLGVAEDRGDAGDDLRRLLGLDEDVEPAGEVRRARQAAADPQVEARRAVGRDHAGQRDIVDQAARAVLAAAGDRDLVLARQVRVELVAEEVLVDGLGGRVAVDDLLVADAGQRAADDVARDVAAGALGGQPAGVEALEDLGDLSSGIQWIWKHWRVVQSTMPRPKSAAMPAIVSACSPVSTPWTTFTRSMKWPSCVLCWYSPYHLSRAMSVSARVS